MLIKMQYNNYKPLLNPHKNTDATKPAVKEVHIFVLIVTKYFAHYINKTQ